MNKLLTVEAKFDADLAKSYRNLAYVMVGLAAISGLMHYFM